MLFAKGVIITAGNANFNVSMVPLTNRIGIERHKKINY